MKLTSLSDALSQNEYPGRGIVLGISQDAKSAACAYFIMGRSENSQNRVFVADGDGIRTQIYDGSKSVDASLIIYAPVRTLGSAMIVSNGDQTDTIYDGLNGGLTFEQSLRSRTFEPDAPNFTPRISGIVTIENGVCDYALSIIKCGDGNHADKAAQSCERFTFAYQNPRAGFGHLLHTYKENGTPLPSFEGEPRSVAIEGDIDFFTNLIWNSLNSNYRISLFTRFIDISTGAYESRIVNKNK